MSLIPRDVIIEYILPYLSVGDSLNLLFVMGEKQLISKRCIQTVYQYYEKKLMFLRNQMRLSDKSKFLKSYLHYTCLFEVAWDVISGFQIEPRELVRPSESWGWRCLQEEIESELHHDIGIIKRMTRLIHTQHWNRYHPSSAIFCTA